MLRKFAAVLLATSLIAGPAFAAQPSGTAGATPAAPAAAAPASTNAATKTVTSQVKAVKTVKHVRKHSRRHVVRHKIGAMKQARHVKTTKTHQSGISHNAKSKKAVG
jgi:hypothetical protein